MRLSEGRKGKLKLLLRISREPDRVLDRVAIDAIRAHFYYKSAQRKDYFRIAADFLPALRTLEDNLLFNGYAVKSGKEEMSAIDKAIKFIKKYRRDSWLEDYALDHKGVTVLFHGHLRDEEVNSMTTVWSITEDSTDRSFIFHEKRSTRNKMRSTIVGEGWKR